MPVPGNPGADDHRLSEAERAVLDDIAGHENASDPAFVAQLSSPVPGVAGRVRSARRRDLAVQAAVVVVVAAVALPSSWLAAAALALLLVVPMVVALVVVSRGVDRGGAGRGGARDGDGPTRDPGPE